MGRSWERMVQKNTKKANQIRKKQGQQAIGSVSQAKSDIDRFFGRNLILPITLIAFAVLYAILYSGVEQKTSVTMFWVTVGLYILLGIVLFIRRPYLNVGKAFLGTRRFNRDIRVDAAQVKQITVQKGYVVIETKAKGSNWVFSRLTNRYDTVAMGERLQEFARTHNVPFLEK
ncbi:hypothetical protein BVG16_23210 [Paenibacillus selenitireducens]|uniref:Methyltransferase n=1 Tax=Paenibacillus selenitireducens TaxID=1324314 RepID=A0A1T2X489_9BACL|nr:hypothetical protein [Paenibacillus selenitireducens]OPA74670.1 hypothetical protein BVG16_23210 [Paenibacillus selenitireducens]